MELLFATCALADRKEGVPVSAELTAKRYFNTIFDLLDSLYSVVPGILQPSLGLLGQTRIAASRVEHPVYSDIAYYPAPCILESMLEWLMCAI